MQQGGTLRKRRRRNIAKVNGLTTLNYNEVEDNFNSPNTFLNRNNNGREKRISVASLFENRRPAIRVTRDATFHTEEHDGFDEDVEFGPSPPRSATTTVPSYYSDGNSIKNRSHFLDKWTMNRLRQTLLLGMFSGTFPWIWNGKTYSIDKWRPFLVKLWNIQWALISLQTCCIGAFQFHTFFKAATAEEHTSYRAVFMSSFSIVWYSLCLSFNLNMYLYKEEIREYINTLFRFNREFMEKYVVDLDDYQDGGRIVINLSIPSNTCQVFVSVTLFLVMPYQPWYLFSFIYPKPWYWLIPGAIHEFVVVGQVIANYCLYQWIIVAHTNSMEFWLRESHRNYDSGYTVDELRHPNTAVETYRALQVLTACFNDCMAPLAMPIMKLSIVGSLISCGYVFFRSMNHLFIDEFPGILTYPIGIIDTATTGFCTLSSAATVYDLGCGFVDSWGQTRHKHFRRILMSCPALKVKVARFYFVTASTTITFFKAVADYIIDCIITFP